MTHSQSILNYLQEHDNQATLGDLLEAGRYSFAHKLTARISDLRKQGHNIVCIEGPNPSQNLYKLSPPSFTYDPSGQELLCAVLSTLETRKRRGK